MVPKQSNTGAIVIIVILAILIIVGIVLIIVFQGQYNNCKDKESPLCLTGNCPATTDACGNSPFKFVDGQIVCKTSIFPTSTVPTVTPLSG
jgi:hypothetical protein